MSDTGLAVPYDPAFRVADYNRMAARARLALQMMPQLGTNPNLVAQLSQAPINPALMAEQTRAMRGTLDADAEKSRFEAMSPSAQRASWELLPAVDQQALTGIGYVLPQAKTSRPPGAELLGDIAAPLGAVYESGFNVASTVGGYALNGLQELGEIPMEMYREIRQQPEIVQWIALAGAAVATGGLGLAAGGALGVGAAGLAGTLGAGVGASVSTYAMGGLTGAYLAAGMASTLRGNPDFWGDTFSLGREAGERDFAFGALDHAAGILGDDGQILSLAAKFGFEGDPVTDLLEEFAGQQNAMDESTMMSTAERLLTDNLGLVPNTEEYMNAFNVMSELTKLPEFRSAVSYLQSQKISMGRDFSNLVGLDPANGLGKIVSGGVDALSWFVLDPVLAAGKLAGVNRALRFGVRSDLAGEELTSRIAKVMSRPATQRRLGHLADALGKDDVASIWRADPDITRLYKPLKKWEETTRARAPRMEWSWDADRIGDFFAEADGLTALAAGKGPSWRHGMLEVPHMSRVGELAQNTRLNLRAMAAEWDVPFERDELLPEYLMGKEVVPTSRDDRIWEGANFVIDMVNNSPVLRRVTHPVAAFSTSMLTKIPSLGGAGKHGFIPLDHTTRGGSQMVEEMGAFTELARVFKVPAYVREQWLNTIVNATNLGERRQAVNYFYEMLFKSVGVRDVDDGAELVSRFVEHSDQAYVSTGGHGIFFSDDASLLAIPNVRQLRQAALDQTIFNKMLNVADGPIFDTFVGKIWKPAVLLRIGFVTRAVGDEMLSWLARDGAYGWIASTMARSAADDDPVAAHVRWLETMWNRVRRPMARDADFGAQAFLAKGIHTAQVSDVDRIHLKLLESYTRGLRAMATKGLGLEGNNPLSRWLTKEGTVRSLMSGGVPDEYLDAARIWVMQPAVKAAVMREVSSGRSVAADAIAAFEDHEKVLKGYGLTDINVNETVSAGGWETISPDTPGAHFDSFRRQASTWTGDGDVMERVAQRISGHVDDVLGAGLDATGAEAVLRHVVDADLPVGRRQFLWNLLLSDDPDRWQAVVNSLHPEDMIRLGWEGSRKTATAERLRNTVDLLEEVGEHDMAALVKEVAAVRGGNHAAQKWLAWHIDRNFVPEMKRGFTQATLEAEVRTAVREAMLEPDAANRISRMEYGSRGARSNVPLARALPEDQVRLFTAYAPRQVMLALPNDVVALQSFLRARNISLSDDAFDLLVDALHNRSRIPVAYAETPMVPLLGATTVDPKLAKEVGGAMATLAKLDNVSVYGELAVPANFDAAGIPWVKGKTEHGYHTIDPLAGPDPTDVSPIAGLQDVDGQLVPGLSYDELIDEYADVYTKGAVDRFFARDATKIINDEEPVRFLDNTIVPDADDIDAPAPVGRTEGYATYRGHQVEVRPAGPDDIPLPAIPDELEGQPLGDLTRSAMVVEGNRITYSPELVAMDFNDEGRLIGPYMDELNRLGVDATQIDEEAYRELLIGIKVREVAGDSLATAVRGQARWQDLVPVGSVITEAPNMPVRRFLWETNGPISIEHDMRIHGRRLTLTRSHFTEDARGAMVGTQYAENIPVASDDLAGLISADELPSSIQRHMASADEVSNLGAYDRFVRFGFGKVIGPMIDSLMRQPLAFHRFANAYVDARRLSTWWMDRALFAPAEGFDELIDATGKVTQIPRKEGKFVSLQRTFHERQPGFHYATLSPEQARSFEATMDDLDLAMGQSGAQRWDTVTRDLSGALNEIDTFLARPARGVPAAGQAADEAARAYFTTTQNLLGNARRTADPDHAGKMLVSWWRQARSNPANRDWLRGLESTDRAVQRKAARQLSKSLRTGSLSPHEIKLVAAASDEIEHLDDLVLKVSQERAIADTIPYIDRDNVRAQGQEYVRNLIPFWFAEDQFMRRWARTAQYAPEMIRKAQLLYMGLSSGGLVKEDEYGNAYFVYPGTTVLAELVGRLPFIDDRLPIAEALTGQVRYSLPGLDRFGVPQVSPLLGIPLDNLTNIFPEMREFTMSVQGDRGGANRGLIRSLMPASMMRFYDAVLSDDGDAKLGSAMMTSAQVLAANGQGLPENATSDQIEEYMDRLRNHARSILLTQALFGFVAPASPQHQVVGDDGQSLPFYDFRSLTGVNTPDVLLTDEYIQLVRNMGVEAGTVEFLAKYPDSTPEDLFNANMAYRVGKTKSVTGAPLPPINPAMDFYDANKTWMTQNPTAGAWLLPPAADAEQADDRDITAYMDQQAAGLRVRKAPQEFIRDLKFATGSGTYFDTVEAMDQKIAANPDSTARHVMETKKSIWQASYLSTHPIFAEELQSGEGRSRRSLVLNKLREAFADPATPQPWHRAGLEVLVSGFDNYRAAMIELAADSSKKGKERRDLLRVAFDDWGTRLTASRPELAPLWNSVIRIEAKVD